MEVENMLCKSLTDNESCSIRCINATVSHGTVRPNHGLKVNLFGKKGEGGLQVFPNSFHGTLDVHGEVFAALPNGLGSLAQMMLPLNCYIEKKQKHSSSSSSTKDSKVLWEGSLTLGAKRLSKETLLSTLEHIVKSNDPSFVFELRDSSKTLIGMLPTKASLILESLNKSESSSSSSSSYNQQQHNEVEKEENNNENNPISIRDEKNLPSFRVHPSVGKK